MCLQAVLKQCPPDGGTESAEMAQGAGWGSVLQFVNPAHGHLKIPKG